MKWTCKATLAAVTLAMVAFLMTVATSPAAGQKPASGAKPASGTKPGTSGTSKTDGPHRKFHKALEVAMKRLKEAEKALLEADVKELDLRNTNPHVVQHLTWAVQQTNRAYEAAQHAKRIGK